jgi:radical SAM protein with 4Fe4S-binding SPASM domain
MSTNNPFEFFIQWHLTEACNLRCRHCYQGERAAGEMSLPEIKAVIGEVSDMIDEWSGAYDIAFSRSMNMTGGEPFLRPDLFAVLEEVRRRDFDVFLLTNGTLVDRARALRLAELGVKGVQVSIEGPEPVHDSIRGAGSFAASAAGIAHLVDAGLAVTLNVTLSRINASVMKEVIAFGSRAGARRIGFSRLVPSGKGSSLLSQMLSPDEVRGLYESLVSLETGDLRLVTGDPVASCLKAPSNGDAGNTAMSGCAAGVSGLTLLPNGDVLPCRRLPLHLGNARRDPLREIWAASPVLEALRDRGSYKGKCGTCSRWAHCRGCRAIAYAWSRSRGEDDFLVEDPQCFLA